MLTLIACGILIAIYLSYSAWRLIYNIFFHPLADFPGPWWAGATSYAEAYYDIVKGGRYFKQIELMHAHYGMFS